MNITRSSQCDKPVVMEVRCKFRILVPSKMLKIFDYQPHWSIVMLLAFIVHTSTGNGDKDGREAAITQTDLTTDHVQAQHPLVLYAVNAGGSQFTSSLGVMYLEDSSTQRVASGGTEALVSTDIARVPKGDLDLYITERYGLESFHYEFPAPPNGKYTLVLKFAEVAFHEPGRKRFSVVLNKKHVVLHDLDIFDKVGYATAHDEFVSFIVNDGNLKHRRKTSKLGPKIQLQFVKGHLDNPKICAFALVKGTKNEARAIMPIDDMVVPPTATSSLGNSVAVDSGQEKPQGAGVESDGGVDAEPHSDSSAAGGSTGHLYGSSSSNSNNHHHYESEQDRLQSLPVLTMVIALCLIGITIVLESYLN